MIEYKQTTARLAGMTDLVRCYFVNFLLLLALGLGLSVRHVVNGALLFLALTALVYCAVVFVRRCFAPHPLASCFADFAVPRFVGYIFLSFTLYASYSLVLYGFAEPGVKDRYENFFIFAIPLYFLFVRSRLRLRYFCYALSFSGLAVGLHALYQVVYLDYPRAVGAHYAIGFGDMALLLALFNALLLLYYPRLWQKLLAVAAVLLACAACFLSVTRGAWLAMPPLLIFMLWVCWREIRYRSQQVGVPLSSYFRSHRQLKWVLLLCVVALFSVVFSQKERIAQRWHETFHEIRLYQQGDVQEKSIILRFEMWRVAWHMFTENPIFGAGYGSFEQEVRRLYNNKIFVVPEGTKKLLFTFNNAHSQYLEELGNKGIVGLVLLLGVFVLPLVWFVRHLSSSDANSRLVAYFGVSSVLGFAIFAATESVFHRSFLICYYLLLVFLFVALLCSSVRTATNPETLSRRVLN